MSTRTRGIIASVVVVAFAMLSLPISAPAQTETVLYNFSNGRDAYPEESLLFASSGLFGTVGGVKGDKYCCGEVFELTQSGGSWIFERVYKFNRQSGGQEPSDGLVKDATGSLYGTTLYGGTQHGGTLFQLQNSDGTWVANFIWQFRKNGRGGNYPGGNLVVDANGSLYGEADGGSHAAGVVFELSQSNGSWTDTVLHNFKGTGDGSGPNGGLLMDGPGSLWGVTSHGGGACDCGTMFHLVSSAGVWTNNVVHRFGNGSDGESPNGPLTEDSKGVFYGTTAGGGDYGFGAVFETLPDKGGGWKEKVIYSFRGHGAAATPLAGLSWGLDNHTLYGTTEVGGDETCGGGSGCGTVFSLRNSSGVWSEATVYNFKGRPDGIGPYSQVTVDESGNLYGTTLDGGTYGYGTIWEITP
ncbi:MAG TPA: choice-of-anchor tandem repeat GloVer-containing protein [Rhizomicrobium sp.]|nr:choice-of-anchor tandem repeat GloVer-containing protein [Rhizomicrobium sp.]